MHVMCTKAHMCAPLCAGRSIRLSLHTIVTHPLTHAFVTHNFSLCLSHWTLPLPHSPTLTTTTTHYIHTNTKTWASAIHPPRGHLPLSKPNNVLMCWCVWHVPPPCFPHSIPLSPSLLLELLPRKLSILARKAVQSKVICSFVSVVKKWWRYFYNWLDPESCVWIASSFTGFKI